MGYSRDIETTLCLFSNVYGKELHAMTSTAQAAPSFNWLPEDPVAASEVTRAAQVTAEARKPARAAEAASSYTPPQRTARISVDKPWIGKGLAALVITQVVALLIISINGLMEIGRWMGTWELALAVSLDATLITATTAALVFRSRGERGHGVYAWTVLILFSMISMTLNSLHILIEDEPTQRLIAAVCYALIYIAMLLILHLGVLVFIAPPDGSPEVLRAQQLIADRGGRPVFADAQSRILDTPQRKAALEEIYVLHETGMKPAQIAKALKSDPKTISKAILEYEQRYAEKNA